MDQGLGGGLSGVFSLQRPVASMYAATSCLMVFRSLVVVLHRRVRYACRGSS